MVCASNLILNLFFFFFKKVYKYYGENNKPQTKMMNLQLRGSIGFVDLMTSVDFGG